MPHAKELVAELRSSGVALGLVSNAQFYTPLLFRAFFDSTEAEMGFDEELILYSYLQGRAKPSLSLFEKARDLLGARSVAPGDALFVGNDMEKDVLPAWATGFQTALFGGDRRSLRTGTFGPEPGRRPPDVVAASLEELSAVLRRGTSDQASSQRTS
jgi:putative hydrolase of the HAD superfamily